MRDLWVDAGAGDGGSGSSRIIFRRAERARLSALLRWLLFPREEWVILWRIGYSLGCVDEVIATAKFREKEQSVSGVEEVRQRIL